MHLKKFELLEFAKHVTFTYTRSFFTEFIQEIQHGVCREFRGIKRKIKLNVNNSVCYSALFLIISVF
jgi:hypothetical protein